MAEKYGAPITVIGTTGGDSLRVTYCGVRYEASLRELFTRWDRGLTTAVGVEE